MTTPTADPLSQLRDIHTPEAISYWWPLAPGWWILGVIIIALIVLITRWVIKRLNHQPVLKQASRELLKLKSATPDKENLTAAFHTLRRAAIYQLNKETAASVPLPMLAQSLANQHQLEISSESIELMGRSQYAPKVSISQQTWNQLLDDINQLIRALHKTQTLKQEAEHV